MSFNNNNNNNNNNNKETLLITVFCKVITPKMILQLSLHGDYGHEESHPRKSMTTQVFTSKVMWIR